MKPNVGKKESLARIVIGAGAGIAALAFVKSKPAAVLLGAIAASGIETGVSRYCPINELIGIDNAPDLKESGIRRLQSSSESLVNLSA